MARRCVSVLVLICACARVAGAQQFALLPDAPHAMGTLSEPEQPEAYAGDDAFVAEPEIQEFRSGMFLEEPQIFKSPGGIRSLHGKLYEWKGQSLAGWNAHELPVYLPSAAYGGSAGGNFNHNQDAYFMGFDNRGFALSEIQPYPDRSAVIRHALGGAVTASAPELSLASGEWIARLDHRWNARDSATLRYDRSSVTDGGWPGSGSGWNAVQQDATISNTFDVSPSTVNETLGHFLLGNVALPEGTPAIGIASPFPTERRFKIYEAEDYLSHRVGNQVLQAGGDFVDSRMSVGFQEGSFGNATFAQSSKNVGFSVVDAWKLSRSLVVTAGMRYDLEFLRNIRTDKNHLAPQLGFAWSPGRSGTTVIRAGYGLTYAQIPLPAISGRLDPSTQTIPLLRSGSFTATRNSLPFHVLGDFTTMNPAMQSGYAEHMHFEVEQQIGTSSVLSASYQRVRGVQLAGLTGASFPLCAAAGGCNLSDALQGGQQFDSGSHSSYSRLTVAFVQHPVRWANYQVAYNYATCQGCATSEDSGFAGDTMRRLSFTGTLHTQRESGSGLWQHLTHGWAVTGYGDLTSREQFPGMDFIRLNAQVSKSFQIGKRSRLELIGQSSNLLAHGKYSIPQGFDDTAEDGASRLLAYDHLAAAGMPNGIQVGLRFVF